MKQEYKPMYEKFGLNVVYYRKRKRLTQMKLAELVDIDRSHISAIELGKSQSFAGFLKRAMSSSSVYEPFTVSLS